MPSQSYHKVVEHLPSLSVEEAEDIIARLKALRGLSSESAPITDMYDGEVKLALQGIIDQLATMGVECPYMGLLQKHMDKDFKEKVHSVIAYFKQNDLHRNELRIALQLGIKLLYDNCVRMGIVVSALTIMRHFHRIPAVVNHEFRGYAESGLLRALVVDISNMTTG